MPLTRADLHSRADEKAARVVVAGGGSQAVIDATGLRTLENVAELIDPAILTGAFDNDSLDEQTRPRRRRESARVQHRPRAGSAG